MKLAKPGEVIFMNPAKTKIYLRHVAGKASPNDFEFSRKGDKLGTVLASQVATFQTSTGPKNYTVYKFKRDFYPQPLFVLAGEAVHGADVQQKYLFENIVKIDIDTRNRLNDLGAIFQNAKNKGVAIPDSYISAAQTLADSVTKRQEMLAAEGYVNASVTGIGIAPLLPALALWGVRLSPWIIRGVIALGTVATVVTAVSYVWDKFGPSYDQAALDRFNATEVVKKAKASLTPQEQTQFDNTVKDLSEQQYDKGKDKGGFFGQLGGNFGNMIGLALLGFGGFMLLNKK